jgi:hypothetical protein
MRDWAAEEPGRSSDGVDVYTRISEPALGLDPVLTRGVPPQPGKEGMRRGVRSGSPVCPPQGIPTRSVTVCVRVLSPTPRTSQNGATGSRFLHDVGCENFGGAGGAMGPGDRGRCRAGRAHRLDAGYRRPRCPGRCRTRVSDRSLGGCSWRQLGCCWPSGRIRSTPGSFLADLG